MEAVAIPPQCSEYVAQTALPRNIVRNKIFNERDHADIDRKNHRIITERLYLAMVEIHILPYITLPMDMEEPFDDFIGYADKAMELATIFESTYKKHYTTRLDFKDFVRAEEMSYEERGLGTMQYEAEKRFRNEHATMTYSHYEVMICANMKKYKYYDISQEDAEMFVRSAGEIVTILQGHYNAPDIELLPQNEMNQ